MKVPFDFSLHCLIVAFVCNVTVVNFNIRVLFSGNQLIPSDLQKDAIDLEKTLNWEDEGGDGTYLQCSSYFILMSIFRS